MTNAQRNRCRFSFRNHEGRFIKTLFSKLLVPALVLFSAFFLLLTPHTVLAAALNLPKDTEGWTKFTPSPDTRIMYVSANGDNDTALVYTSANHPDWANPQSPSGTINSFATFAAAYAHLRSGYPDWVLFKRGDTLYDTVGQVEKQGRSTSEPILIGAYGSSGLSPLLKVGSVRGIFVSERDPFAYLAVQGIRFYAHTRNSDDPEYNAVDNGNSGVELSGRYMSNILIEGCAFMYPRGNIVRGEYLYDRARDIEFRRNLFLNSYQIATSHAQGLVGSHTENLLLEENVFDHNGWLIQSIPAQELPEGWNEQTGGQATMKNHNIYLGNDKGTIIKNNISMRPSSIHFKHAVYTGVSSGIAPIPVENLMHDNNLLIDGEVGVDVSGNNLEVGVTVKNYTCKNNVIYKLGLSKPTNRGLAWAIGLSGFGDDGGTVHDNIILNNNVPLDIGFTGIIFNGPVKNLDIYNNIFYSGVSPCRLIDVAGEGVNTTIRNNEFRSFSAPGVGTPRMMYAVVPTTGYAFSSNAWSGNGTFNDNEDIYSLEQWQTSREPSASIGAKVYPDNTRTIETYMASIGDTATLEAFIERCRAQDRYNWDTRFSANTVNSWIRAGFIGSTGIAAPAQFKVTY